MGIIDFAVGFIMLVVGRQAYPFFVGGVGYLLGKFLQERVPLIRAEFNEILFPLLIAVLAGILALGIQRVAAWIAGFFSGVYLVYMFPQIVRSVESESPLWMLIAAGVLAAALLIASFDFFMVALSSATGALVVVETLPTQEFSVAVLFIVFVFFGMIAQYIILQYGEPYPD